MSKFAKISFIVGILVLGVFITMPYLMSATAEDLNDKLQVYLQQNKATPQEKEAYEFAIAHPEVLKNIPCYCGCGKLGHKSNLHCFINGNPKTAKQQPFDDHGFICPMCVDIARGSKKFYNEGKSVAQIRQIVDKAFEKHPKLEPTPTPKPAP